jgi:RNA polymerase sigma factor (sigma-70 family)
MDAKNLLAVRFEAARDRLRGVAYRMLGSAAEAEDAVQEAWLRAQKADLGAVGNLDGWLTTTTARICLDQLRSRRARREDALDEGLAARTPDRTPDPEQEALLAESIGLALLVVLETLPPAERIAFVLHDMFDLPFDQIAPIVERSPEAARQLASRARKRVKGRPTVSGAELARQRTTVEAFLTASRNSDLQGVLAVLDPDVVFRADATAASRGSRAELVGAEAVAGNFLGRAQTARAALVDGALALLVAPAGKLMLVVLPTWRDGRIVGLEAVGDPDRLAAMELAMLDG